MNKNDKICIATFGTRTKLYSIFENSMGRNQLCEVLEIQYIGVTVS